VKHNVLNAKLHKKEADIVQEAGQAGMVTIATNMAGRGTDIKLSDEVKNAGGLAIVGTERHDSRRVDRQLRGRSGRQGDPGSSQFYVALDDNLMRLFGSERIAKMMDKMGLKEGEVIQHSMISKSIERAQKKVEENNFGIRKRLLEYDDVMNAQREVVYKRRYNALFGDRLSVDIANMIFDTAEVITEDNKAAQDYKNFEFELIRYFSISSPVNQSEFENMNSQEIAGVIYKSALKHYQEKMVRNAEIAFPVIKNVYETQKDQYKRILVPFTDGVKNLNVATDLEKAYTTEGKQLIQDFEKNISLAIIDDAWKTHLRKMDELKQSVQLAVHEQKDPLLIYKFEAFELFKEMIVKVNKDVISFLFKGELPQKNQQQIREARQVKANRSLKEQKDEIQNLDERASISRAAGQTQRQQQQVTETIVREQPKIGRNDKVTIKNVMSGENKTLKYKQAIPLINKGEWVLVD
jgi:preprotein translocase subunit SecA